MAVRDFVCVLKLLAENLNTNFDWEFILGSFYRLNMKLYENLLGFEKVTSIIVINVKNFSV